MLCVRHSLHYNMCMLLVLLRQLSDPTEWKRKALSAKLRALHNAPSDDDSPLGEWRCYVHLPAVSEHQNHLTQEQSEVRLCCDLLWWTVVPEFLYAAEMLRIATVVTVAWTWSVRLFVRMDAL